MTKHDEHSQQPEDAEFLKRAKGAFQESVQGIDAQTRSRLNRGRQQALAASEGRAVVWNNWLPLGAAAAVALVAVVMWNAKEQPDAFTSADFTAPTMATDFDILLDEDELEMLEDLEFYSWIDLDEELYDSNMDEHVG
ncbi:MAG: hypothetical protein WBM68_15030 [Woeseia sp.]